MRQSLARSVALLSVAVVLFTAVTSLAGAQTGTAPATPRPGGIIVEFVGSTPLSNGQRLDVVRVTLGPNASVPLHAHPGTGLLWVESGTISYAVSPSTAPVCAGGCKGPMSITVRGSQLLLNGKAAPAGVLQLRPGDAVVEQPAPGRPATPVTHTYRAGPDGAIVLISRVLSRNDHDTVLPDTCQPDARTGRCSKPIRAST